MTFSPIVKTSARTVYNSRVTQWNTDIFAWPTKMIVAARQGYTTRIPFTASSETRAMARHSALGEHEALANYWGQNHFKHPSCVTDCILKTEQKAVYDDHMNVKVYAYGY